MKNQKYLAAVALALGLTSQFAGAQVVADRATLDALVGSSALTHDFETAPVLDGSSTLSYAGVIISASNAIQYNAPGYYGAPSHELNLYYSTGTFDFTAPVGAFGMDLRAYEGYPSTVNATMFAADDVTEIATISSIGLSATGVPIFFGYQGAAIGKVEFHITGYTNFDNLTFGTVSAVPEPATYGMLFAGLAMLGFVARRRKAA